jgi:hypothetical protein
MKIRPIGVDLFHAERQANRQTDITKLIVAFLNFANAPKKRQSQYLGAKTEIAKKMFCLVTLISSNPDRETIHFLVDCFKNQRTRILKQVNRLIRSIYSHKDSGVVELEQKF